jgi:hypothetical protein
VCTPEPEIPPQDDDDQLTLDDFEEGEDPIDTSGDEDTEQDFQESDEDEQSTEIRAASNQELPNALIEVQADENTDLVYVNTEHRLFSALEDWFLRRFDA